MKSILKRVCAGIMALVMLVCLFPVSALALSAQEQEDFYRVNTWWQDEYNQQYIDWLLESDNFMYHLDISTGDIIHDMSYGSLNLDPKQRKDNFVEILTSFIGLSYDEIREQSAAEVYSDISVEFLDGFKDFLEDTQLYTVDQFKYMEKAINETSDYYLSCYYGIDTDMGEYGYQAIYERIQSAFDNNVQDFDWPDHKAETMQEFYNFVDSSEWHSKLSKASDIFDALGDSVELAKDGIALVGELESYNRTDEKLVELLKYIRAKTTDNALRAACDEVITKFENSYTQNIVRGVLEIAADTTLEWAYDEVKDLIVDKCGIYGIWAKIGIVAGNAVSDLWFNTTETKQQMQTIYCLDHISELLVPLLRTELQDLYSYDGASDFGAAYAADAIYHMSVLIELRKKGEESYYKLKDSVYGSSIIEACKTLGWGSFSDDQQIIEAWYSEFTYVIDAVKGSLYKMIPAYHYYKKPEPAEFEKEGSRLISYNGNSVNVYIPTDIYCDTIDSYAFNGNETIESVNIPYTIKTINANAFYNCTNLKSVTINSTEAVIADGAFVNCHEGFTIYGYAGSTAQTFAIANNISFKLLINGYDNAQDYVDAEFVIEEGVLVQYSGNGGDVYIPYGVTEIASYAFDCTYSNISSIIIPDTVNKINEYAFNSFGYTEELTGLVIGSGVSEIVMPICDSVNFSEVVVDAGNKTYYSEDGVLFDRNNKELVYYPGGKPFEEVYQIPEGISSVNQYAFYQYYGQISICELYIPESVTELNDALSWIGIDTLASIRVSENNPTYTSYQGILYDKQLEELLFVPQNISGDIVIPDSVTKIRSKAVFDWCHNLKNLTVGDGLKNMPSLFDCSSLESVVIGKSVESYPYNAFGQCYSLKTLFLNAENTENAVCPPFIEKLTVGKNVECFYADHYNCEDLLEIEFSNPGMVIYGENIFNDTSYYWTASNWDNGALYIGTHLIKVRESVKDYVVRDGTTVICSSATSSLFSIGLPNTVQYIGEWCFDYNNLIHLFYEGTESTWGNITIADNNDHYVTKHYEVLQGMEAPQVIEPTCLETGITIRKCGICKQEYEYDFQVALGHQVSEEWIEQQKPTCTTDGIKVKICQRCNEIVERQETKHAGHSYETYTVLPSCEERGYTTHICSICQDQYNDNYTDETGHSYTAQIVPSSCTEDGVTKYTCSSCGNTYLEIISAKHTWSTEWTVDVQETCTTAGSKSHHCLNCEEKTDVTEIPAAHKWSDEWTVDVEATETTEGSQSRHCTRCDAKTDVTVIPMLSTESPATDFEYSIRNNEVTIDAYIGTSGIMNIPTHIEGYPVTTISSFAFSGNTTITKATIPYTVTNIKYYAFNNCSELLEVNLGSGITVLPESLFSRCGKLQKVSLPANLTTIQSNAFYYCESLVEMAIPDTVEVIEDSAFYECLWYANLSEDTVAGTGILLRLNTEFGKDVVIPDGVHTIYICLTEGAFTNTYVDQVALPASITSWNQVDLGVRASSYVVDEDNKYFIAVDGVIYSKDMSTVIAVPSRVAEEISLPETVTTIGSGAFYSSNLSKITLHKGVIELKEGAFSYCSNLTEITIPDSVISIENNAFRGGNDNLVILCGLGSCAAAYAVDNNISFRILATPKELSIASLPSKLTYPIGGTLDLSGLSLSAVYEDGTTATVSTGYTVSDYDFSTAGTKVITVSLGELSITFEVVVDPNLVVYPESDHPYANNSNQIWNYIHPSSADQLIITFSDDTETENNYDKIYIYDGNGNEVGVYSGTQLAGASITVNGNKFSIKLTSDSSVTKNGFTVVSVEAIILCDHSYGEWIELITPSCTVDGVEYRTCSVCGNEESQAIAAIGHDWETEWTVDVEPTETSEGSKSRHCINCEATVDVIVIPMLNVSPVEDFVYTVNNSTVTITDYIGTDTTVTIPSSIDGYPVTTIGVYAFADCTDLTRIVIPSSITVVGNWAFSNCTGLTNITIPDSVTYIGIFAFNNCSNLTDITVGNGVVTIADSVFSNCSSLISVNIPRSVTNIGNYVFSGCNSLNGIWVAADNPYYSSDDQGVLYNKNKTKLIRAPGGLGSVTIPNSVTNIGISAFSYSNVLSNVVIPSSVTSIGEYAFYDCTKLKAVYYCGTNDQWDAVVVSDNNTNLESAIRCIGEISFAGASLSLQHNLAINYKVDKALFESVDYTNPYVVFELNGVKTKVSSYTISGDRYIFTFRNIAPNQMNDTIKATLYATYDGVEYASATREYSVAEYCYSMLELYAADQYAELRTLLVDLLNYGAASQTYTGYRTDVLVNASLTDVQLQWGTSEEPALDTVLDTTYKTVENPTAKWKGAGLHLQEAVAMRLKFTAENIDSLTVKIESGESTWTISSDKFLEEDDVYYVYFTGLDAGQMRQSVYLTIYDGDTPVSNTVCYSIGSYAYEKQNSTIAGLPELVKAIMKYGDSAYAYVH